jgi:hypothetical protein
MIIVQTVCHVEILERGVQNAATRQLVQLVMLHKTSNKGHKMELASVSILIILIE